MRAVTTTKMKIETNRSDTNLLHCVGLNRGLNRDRKGLNRGRKGLKMGRNGLNRGRKGLNKPYQSLEVYLPERVIDVVWLSFLFLSHPTLEYPGQEIPAQHTHNNNNNTQQQQQQQHSVSNSKEARQ